MPLPLPRQLDRNRDLRFWMPSIRTQSLPINPIGLCERTCSNGWEELLKHQTHTTEPSVWLKTPPSGRFCSKSGEDFLSVLSKSPHLTRHRERNGFEMNLRRLRGERCAHSVFQPWD